MFMVVAENGATHEFSEQLVQSDHLSWAISGTTTEGVEHIVQCSHVCASVTTTKNIFSFYYKWYSTICSCIIKFWEYFDACSYIY